MSTLLSDLRFSWRGLKQRPVFALTLLLTLSIGTGAIATVFSLVQAVLLRPFPFPDGKEIVEIQTISTKAERNVYGTSFQDAQDLEVRVESFEEVGVFRESRINIVPEDRAVPAQVTHVTPGFFDVLGVPALHGRTFEAADDVPGGDSRKVVLAYSAWQTLFGGRQDILGQQLRTAMGGFEVVGVMPAGVAHPARTDLWVPLQSHFDIRGLDRTHPRHRGSRLYDRAIARLGDDADLERSRLEVATVSAQLGQEYPDSNGEFTHHVVTLREAEAGAYQPYLLLLLGAVLLVVAVCCTNVAGLLIARTASRVGEFGVRTALGAGGGRLTRQLLTEGLMIGVLGGGLGLLISVLAVRLTADYLAGLSVLPAWVRLEVDPRVLAAGMLVAVGSGLLAALGPLVMVRRVGPLASLHASARVPRRQRPLQSAMVVAEVALSMVLLVAAALLLASFGRLEQVDTGLQTERVSTVSLSAYRGGTNEERIRAVTSFYRQVIEKIETIPGVVAVGGSDNFPYGSRFSSARNEMRVEARGESEEASGHRAGALLIDVTPAYFQAVGIPLLAGRTFTEGDTLDAPWVIVLSETAALRLFPDRDPLGQEVRMTYEGGGADPWAQVVGVVGDVKYEKREASGGFELYYPYTQYGLVSTTLAIRTRGPTPGLEQRVHEAVASVDPTTAVERIESLDVLVADTLWRERLAGGLLAACALIAVILAAIGLYGIVSYGVASRVHEIGVRMALGSAPARVLLEVTGSGLRLVMVGIAVGAVGAMLMVPLLRSYLFEAGRLDVVAYLVPALFLVLVGAVACLRPSLRASRVDPIRVLSRG